MTDRRERRIRLGIILMMVGIVFFAWERFDFLESESILLLLGLGFLGGYLWKRRYGLMVPAGVLMGIGAGKLFEENFASSVDGGQLGLGLGFLSVFAVPLLVERKSHWWPLIPGGFLILSAFDATDDISRILFRHWPLTLVAFGAMLVLAGWLDRGRARSD